MNVVEVTVDLICSIDNLCAACIDGRGGVFLVTRKRNFFGPATLWKLSLDPLHLRHLGFIPLIAPRSLFYDSYSNRLYVLSGGLPGWHGMGYVISAKVSKGLAWSLNFSSAKAISTILFRIVMESIRGLLSGASLTGLHARVLHRLKSRSLGAGLSWPTYLYQPPDSDEILVILSTEILAAKPGRSTQEFRSVASGFLNLVSCSPWVQGRMLLTEMHLFGSFLRRKYGIGTGALWDFDPVSGAKTLIAGGICDGTMAVSLRRGQTIAIATQGSSSSHLSIVDLGTRRVSEIDCGLAEPKLLLRLADNQLLVGNVGAIRRITISDV